MTGHEENNLTQTDPLSIMCNDIRAIAQEKKFGTLYYPTMKNPSIVMELHDGLIKQADVLFENVKHENGEVILPDRKARYRAD